MLANRLERETEANALSRLAQALASVAGRMEPAQAAQVCGQAANLLAAKLVRETDASTRNTLAQALASVAGRMELTQAAKVCGQAA